MKYIKLFESFLNEELSPETLKSFRQKALAEFQKGGLDANRRLKQANMAQIHLSPDVKNAISEFEKLMNEKDRGEWTWCKDDVNLSGFRFDRDGIEFYTMYTDEGLSSFHGADLQMSDMDGSEAGGVFSFSIWMRDNSSNGDPSAENNFKSDIVQKILIDKDSYEILFENWQDRKYKGNKEGSHLQELWIAMTSNKAFIEPLKRLISLIQKNEIVAKEKKKSWFS